LYALGECNFSDHGANRLGASALMQGLADGYFIIPYTVGDYLANQGFVKMDPQHPAFKTTEDEIKDSVKRLLAVNGKRTVDEVHRELGKVMWESVGMARDKQGLEKAVGLVRDLRESYWKEVKVIGANEQLNESLEKAGRVADFLELAELMAIDALQRDESCGGHFRTEHQTPDGEALRNDDQYAYVSAWEYQGAGSPPLLNKEELRFDFVKPSQRVYT
jgi:succinate dehydrogenase / fumarate reductase flavoprotein subunit